MNKSEHLDTSTSSQINEALELYAEEIQQTFSFVEIATEVKDDVRSRDYFKIAFAHLQKAAKIILKLSDEYPSHANIWILMSKVVKAYDNQLSNTFEWFQFTGNPAFDITIPSHIAKNRKYIKKNRTLASRTNKLELKAEKKLRVFLE